MNPVLDAIERELFVALRRRNGRRRRRRSLLTVAGVGLTALAMAGIGIAAVSDGPIDRLLNGDSPLAKNSAAPREDLHLTDPGGLEWTVTTYTSQSGMLASTAAPVGLSDRLPSAGGSSGFVIADNLLDGPVSGLGLEVVRRDGVEHYLFSGTVTADVREITIELGSERQAAMLSSDAIQVPVEQPPHLTEIGRERAARMPPAVSVRSYAASFTPDLLADQQIVRATIEAVLTNGTHQTMESGPLCVSAACGARIAEVN